MTLRRYSHALALLAAATAAPLSAGAAERTTATGTTATGTTATGTTATGTTATGTTSAPLEARPLVEGQGVRVARSVFVDAQGRPHDTAEGLLEISPAAIARATGLSRGYLQVVTDLGPVAYNLPFDATPGASLPPRLQRLGVRGDGRVHDFQVPFALASDAPIVSLTAKLVVTDAPVLDQERFDAVMETARASRWLVQAVPEAIGGEGPGTIQSPPLPPLPPAPPWAGGFKPGFEVDWQYLLPNPLNVEAGRNQCAPAAYANALAYLDATFGHLGVQFPQQHIPGVAIDGDEDSLVSRVDWYMDRPAASTCIGEATNRCGDAFAENPSSAIRGIFEYLYLFDSDERVAVRHQASQAVLPGGCGLDEALDRESVREGAQVSFDWLCDRVQEGAGVVLSFGYYTQAQFEGGIQLPGEELDLWQRTGGHVVRVFGCGEIAGKKFIRTLDDGQQDRMIDTDADDEVDTCEARGGLRQQLWFLDQGSIEGRLLLGSDSRQIEFALALTPAL